MLKMVQKVIWVENVEVFKPSGLLFKILSKSFAYCGVFNVFGGKKFYHFYLSETVDIGQVKCGKVR